MFNFFVIQLKSSIMNSGIVFSSFYLTIGSFVFLNPLTLFISLDSLVKPFFKSDFLENTCWEDCWEALFL